MHYKLVLAVLAAQPLPSHPAISIIIISSSSSTILMIIIIIINIIVITTIIITIIITSLPPCKKKLPSGPCLGALKASIPMYNTCINIYIYIYIYDKYINR